MFDVHGCILKHDKDLDATKRCEDYFNWYKQRVLLPIWKKDIYFDKGVPVEYYDKALYHRPIMAIRFQKSICYYLKSASDNVYYETFVTFITVNMNQ